MSSPIDDLFFELYGYRPAKDGQAYEMLLAAALKLLKPNEEVEQSQFIRGEVSSTMYQVDAIQTEGERSKMGEAKDYTLQEKKVGRSDVQKLAGALPDLKIESGILASATGFTKPAVKYAAKAKEIVGSDIALWDVRPVVDGDLKGRIQTIVFRMTVRIPNYDNSTFIPVWTADGTAMLNKMLEEGIIKNSEPIKIGKIFRADGTLVTTIHDISSRGFGSLWGGPCRGSFVFAGGHIQVRDRFIPIHGITYEVPYKNGEVREMVIRADGKATLLTRSLDGAVDKVIRDADLRRVEFSPKGSVTLKGKGVM